MPRCRWSVAALVTVVYGGYADRELGFTGCPRYALLLGFVGCLLGSVLLHKLGHALTARRYGIGVRGITLELLGGYTEMDRDARAPGRGAGVAGRAGRLAGVGRGWPGVAAAVLPGRTVAGEVVFQIAASNVIVAVFNLLPGLPLDGGRALRAGLWALTGPAEPGDGAGRVDRAGHRPASPGAVLLGLYRPHVLRRLGLVFILLVAFTLWQGAGQSIRLARRATAVPRVDLAALARPLVAVPSGTSIAEAQRRAGVAEPHGAGLAVADSAAGSSRLVDGAAAAAVPAERRPWVTVDTVSRELSRVPAMRVELTGEQVVRAVQAHPGARYVVTSGEDVVGVLHVADLAEVLEPRRAARRTAAG